MSNQDLSIRVAQVMLAAGKRITVLEAIEIVLRERYTGPNAFDDLLKASARFVYQVTKKLVTRIGRKDLPEPPDPRQLSLIALGDGDVIVVGHGLNRQAVPLNDATYGEVLDWARGEYRSHSVQTLRYGRLLEELQSVPDLSRDTPWPVAKGAVIAKQKAILETKDEDSDDEEDEEN